MAAYFFDTTALAKHYCLELGSNKINEILQDKKNRVILGECAVTELYATLNKKVRRNEITRDDYYTIVYKFESELEQGLFHFIDITALVIKNSKLFLLYHPALRFSTALHLSLAVEVFALKPTVVSADSHLVETAKVCGFKVLNPEK